MMARQQNSPSSPSTRERAIEAYESTRERAREGVDGSPLLALGGGLALGALIAALRPKTSTADRLLGSGGGRGPASRHLRASDHHGPGLAGKRDL